MTLDAAEPVLDRLQEALRREHALIVQVLGHGYRIDDVPTLHVLEGIARQDMRHFKWLAERVVSLGGVPTLARDPVFLETASPRIWLARDVALVEEAIARYRVFQDERGSLEPGLADDLYHLYDRILGDKHEHREKLLGLVAHWDERPEPVPDLVLDGDAHQPDPQTHGFLEFAIGHEYEVILQYLHHAFLLEDQHASRALEEIAIEEMRHLGWLSEKLVDHGGCPFWEAKRLELHDDAVRMLELDQARELEVEADYQQMTAAMADPAIRHLFDRIGAHEKFHGATLGHLITRLKAQRATQAPPVDALPMAISAAVPAPVGCPVPHPHLPTVGSLLGSPQP